MSPHLEAGYRLEQRKNHEAGAAETVFCSLQVDIMTKSGFSDGGAGHAGLVRIHFPWVKIEDKRIILFNVDLPQTPAGKTRMGKSRK